MKTSRHIFLSCLMIVFFTCAPKVHAVPVDFLPPVPPQDLVLGNAVNEGALGQALEKWRTYANNVLAKFEAMDAAQADRMLLSEESPIDTMDGPVEKVAEILEPLFTRTEMLWDPEEWSREDRQVVDLLARYGLEPANIEGWQTVLPNKSFFRKRISYSEDGQAYLAVLDSQPEYYFVIGGSSYGTRQMGDWAVQWEQYLKTNPGANFVQAAKQRYRTLMDYILFSDMPNTPAFGDDGRMGDYWIDALDSLVTDHSNTKTSAIVSEYLADVRANDRKLSKENRKQTTARLDAAFQPTQQDAPKSAEEKVLGKHMFALQWVSWEQMGVATVTRKGEGLYIDAKQEYEGNYVTLQGDLTVVDDKTFIVTGELVTRVDHIAGGNPCPRTGSFKFKVTGQRKYWRLQQMENPCSDVADYVDVFF